MVNRKSTTTARKTPSGVSDRDNRIQLQQQASKAATAQVASRRGGRRGARHLVTPILLQQ